MKRRAGLKKDHQQASDLVDQLKSYRIQDPKVKLQVNKVLALYSQFAERMREIDINSGRVEDFILHSSQAGTSQNSSLSDRRGT